MAGLWVSGTPIHCPKPKLKRPLDEAQVSAEEALIAISSYLVIGLIDHAAIWACPEPAVENLLEKCSMGTKYENQDTQQEVEQVLRTIIPPRSPDVGEQGTENHCTLWRFSYDEAFFLVHVLKAAHVYVEERKGLRCLTSVELWAKLQEANPDFWLSYAAYEYYRQKGWIVRSGLLYGADFVLYAAHPSSVHADCCVLLMPKGCSLSWNDLQISNRLCTQVGKELVLLYGTPAKDFDLSSIASLDHIQIEERRVMRWIPEKEAART
eukprot:jgi/Botrbrau1/20939/Bobra.0135s0067.2